ncbi:kinase-like domain-containing protein [Rhizophagus diaphanus]|nr:kinase-like domain-containing protein [Rhizophagus diaphanus] [Rhizophagus sp. MUCL 43196]
MDMDLRKFLQQNHNRLTWEKRIMITFYIVDALNRIHGENAIHRDLHSKNILYNSHRQKFYISDLGFCGPANRPLESVYGNLPYIAPEAINSKGYTFKSDIYSIAMIISSGQPPFINYEHNCDLAMNIINGIRPKIVPGTPLEYKNLMEQCWDADPLKRPNIRTLWGEIKRINILYQNTSSKLIANNESKRISCSNSELYSASKFHQFENLPEPRNATEEFHSTYNFEIPDNIEDFNKSSGQTLKNVQNNEKIKFKEASANLIPIDK